MKKQIDNSKAIKVLEKEWITGAEFFKKDSLQFDYDTISFDANDVVTCIRARMYLEAKGFRVRTCDLCIPFIDGIPDKHYGVLTFQMP